MANTLLDFSDRQFKGLLLRTLHHTRSGGVDPGVVIETALKIEPGNWESWHQAWQTAAEITYQTAVRTEQEGRRGAAGGVFLRAAECFRNAFFPLLVNPRDRAIQPLADQMQSCFAAALPRLGFTARSVEIPYGGAFLYGCLISPDSSGAPRPTVIVNSGYTVFLEEEFFLGGWDALQRGMNCFLFDGPGQGHTWVRNGLHFQPESEFALSLVVEQLLKLPGVAPDRIALFARSFYSALALRAVASEKRIAALVLDPGEMCRLPSLLSSMSEEARNAAKRGDYAAAAADLRVQFPTERAKLGLKIRMAQHDLTDEASYLRTLADYDAQRFVSEIRCPVLVGCAEMDPAKEQATELFDRLALPAVKKEFHMFKAAQAAGDHCELGAPALSHDYYFDWLIHQLS